MIKEYNGKSVIGNSHLKQINETNCIPDFENLTDLSFEFMILKK